MRKNQIRHVAGKGDLHDSWESPRREKGKRHDERETPDRDKKEDRRAGNYLLKHLDRNLGAESTGETGYHAEQIDSIFPHHGEHPSAKQSQHHKYDYHLRQERQSLLLNGSRGLEYRYDETDDEGGTKNWRAQHYHTEDTPLHKVNQHSY